MYNIYDIKRVRRVSNTVNDIVQDHRGENRIYKLLLQPASPVLYRQMNKIVSPLFFFITK